MSARSVPESAAVVPAAVAAAVSWQASSSKRTFFKKNLKKDVAIKGLIMLVWSTDLLPLVHVIVLALSKKSIRKVKGVIQWRRQTTHTGPF